MNLRGRFVFVFVSLFTIQAYSKIDCPGAHNLRKTVSVENPSFSEQDFISQIQLFRQLRDRYERVKTTGVELKPIVVLDTGVAGDIVQYEGLNVIKYVDLTGELSSVMRDTEGHGTGISSVIGSSVNGRGITGVLPGHPLIVIRIGSSQEFFIEQSIPFERFEAALQIAAESGAATVNMSWTASPKNWSAEKTKELIWSYQDRFLLVNAPGNSGREIKLGDPAGDVPATVYAPNLVKVGALNAKGVRHTTSDYGPAVDLFYRGTGIPEWRVVEDSSVERRYEIELKSGTSHSAPFIAALSEILRMEDPTLSPGGRKIRLLEELAHLGAQVNSK